MCLGGYVCFGEKPKVNNPVWGSPNLDAHPSEGVRPLPCCQLLESKDLRQRVAGCLRKQARLHVGASQPKSCCRCPKRAASKGDAFNEGFRLVRVIFGQERA